MRAVDGPEAELIVDHLRWFLKLFTGCTFAAMHGREEPNGRIAWAVLGGDEADPDLPGLIDLSLDEFAAQELAGAIVFPELRSEEQVVALLRRLNEGGTRTMTRSSESGGGRRMGIARARWASGPSGACRQRAPYTTIIVWPGAHVNPHQTPKPGEVGFVSMTLPDGLEHDEPRYRRLWDDTREQVKRLRAYPRDGSARPDVAFALPQRCRVELSAFAGIPT